MAPLAVAVSPQEWEALQRLAAAVVAACPGDVLEVRLFGSRARGDARPDSDVDLLVVVRDDASDAVRDAVRRAHDAEWNDEYALCVPLVMPESDFRRHQSTRDLLYRDLRNQGICVRRNGADLWNEERLPVAGRERDVRFHTDQAEHTLRGARLLLAEGELGGTASRAYYAAFHAASAALLTENIERAKHGNLIGEFNRLCHQDRLLGREFYHRLDDLYNLRYVADYGNEHVKEKEAKAAVQTAERFVSAARKYCEGWLDER